MSMHYFDWTATAKPTDGVIAKANTVMAEEWGNPSSVHGFGTSAAKLKAAAENEVLRGLGFGRTAPGKVIFTSGGTEANNLALLGHARSLPRAAGKVLITEGEHASVEECAKALSEMGFTVVRIPTIGGRLDIDAVRSEASGVVLASFMLVNNETGAVYDVASAAKAVREESPSAFIHCDAVQGFMKIRFTPERLGVNAVSVSAHKIGGLKGTGALYVDRDSLKRGRITPVILGGGQEDGVRSGTENVPGIAAFGEAVREAMSDFTERMGRVSALRQILVERLTGTGLVLNLPETSVPGILSVTVPGIKSETVVNFLSREGYFISAGSACSSHGHGMSMALTGFGISPVYADSTVRISLSHLNTEEELDALAVLLCRSLTEHRGLKEHK